MKPRESDIAVIAEALRGIDTDGNGLQFQEFKDYIRSQVPYDVVVRALFTIVDENADDIITTEDFAGNLRY